jgi:hypothetical protein
MGIAVRCLGGEHAVAAGTYISTQCAARVSRGRRKRLKGKARRSFLKKRTKKLLPVSARIYGSHLDSSLDATDKSFLLLFFQKRSPFLLVLPYARLGTYDTDMSNAPTIALMARELHFQISILILAAALTHRHGVADGYEQPTR